jgi:NIPSNAP/TAT (twin-arginine translocation) pathway signal sequence
MQRRDFLLTAGAAGALAATHAAVAQIPNEGAPRQYFEWRTYRLTGKDKQVAVDKYLKEAAIPAWERMGLDPVGVFTELGPNGAADVHVLLAYPTIEKFAGARTALEADEKYKASAAEYLGVKKDAPAFSRIDSWLLLAFASQPQLTPPAAKPRVLEMRTYESFGEDRARAKVDMFNAGEIPIFIDCGFEPVFFGETLVGSGVPCLKYMLAAPDMAANEAGWKKFQSHPDWLAMRDKPEYADTVSNIKKLFLEPTAYSKV